MLIGNVSEQRDLNLMTFGTVPSDFLCFPFKTFIPGIFISLFVIPFPDFENFA